MKDQAGPVLTVIDVYHPSQEIAHLLERSGVTKAKLSFSKTFALALQADAETRSCRGTDCKKWQVAVCARRRNLFESRYFDDAKLHTGGARSWRIRPFFPSIAS